MKKERNYGLFERIDGKWVRQHPNIKGTKKLLVRLAQDWLLNNTFNGKEVGLRPLNE